MVYANHYTTRSCKGHLRCLPCSLRLVGAASTLLVVSSPTLALDAPPAPHSFPAKQVQVEDELMLAISYQDDMPLEAYWMSEKLDGIRAVWTGQELLTRKGRKIYAPDWFIKGLPAQRLEGELWAGRGAFQRVQQTVLDSVPDQGWHDIQFMLFDLPDSRGSFAERYRQLVEIVDYSKLSHVGLVTQQPISSRTALMDELLEVDEQGGEGLILRKSSSLYQAGRSKDMLKVKRSQDAEGIVVGYRMGKGKYQGMVGSLQLRLASGRVLYVGSGLSDKLRRDPPQLGKIVTFRYNGYTSDGLPRFARFLRERAIEE